jgi:hypothetical protein
LLHFIRSCSSLIFPVLSSLLSSEVYFKIDKVFNQILNTFVNVSI